MTQNAASETSLGDLHNKVAKVMTTALEVQDRAQEVYLAQTEAIANNPDDMDLVAASVNIKAPEVNASLLSVMTKFLSDNKISCAPADSKEMGGLEKILNNKKARRGISNVVHLDTGT